MKQYTGTKTVQAEPMTMGEAYERRLLKEGVRPSECETDKAGYLVRYADGYLSWSPAEAFESAYRPSETFLDRLSIEREEVAGRLERLADAMRKDGFKGKVGEEQWALLQEQLNAMLSYVRVLNERIKLANR